MLPATVTRRTKRPSWVTRSISAASSDSVELMCLTSERESERLVVMAEGPIGPGEAERHV